MHTNTLTRRHRQPHEDTLSCFWIMLFLVFGSIQCSVFKFIFLPVVGSMAAPACSEKPLVKKLRRLGSAHVADTQVPPSSPGNNGLKKTVLLRSGINPRERSPTRGLSFACRDWTPRRARCVSSSSPSACPGHKDQRSDPPPWALREQGQDSLLSTTLPGLHEVR